MTSEPFKSTSKLSYFLNRGIGLAAVLFFMTSLVSYKSLSEWISDENDIRESMQLIGYSEKFLSILKDTHTGAREFILTGNWIYLTPYYDGITAFPRARDDFFALLRKNPGSSARINMIRELTTDLFAHCHQVISLNRSKSLPAAEVSMQIDRGETLMEKIRRIIYRIRAEENIRYTEQHKLAQQRARISRMFLFIGDLVTLFLIVSSMVLLKKERTVRDRTEAMLARNEAELRKNQEDLILQQGELERAVEERTRELVESNSHLKISLKEKEALLSEAHHRVKNNFQVVASLLQLSHAHSGNSEARTLLMEAHSKIHAMSLIHEQLYSSEQFHGIDMKEHVQTLTKHISSLYGDNGSVETVITGRGFRLDVTQAVPCALVLNELISNAYKYAFSGMSHGLLEIALSMPSPRRVSLAVKDNGVGLPPDLDLEAGGTLGFSLVRGIVRHQLKGDLWIHSNGGTEVRLEFPKSEKESHHEQAVDRR